MGNGTISTNDLMQKLVNAKKVMNKVDSGNFERGQIDESKLYINSSESTEMVDNITQIPTRENTRPVGNASPERIQNSKLPDAIKRAMIENPIPQISLSDSLDMDFVKGAKRLMEQEGVINKPTKQTSQRPTNQSVGNIDMNAIAILIENTVRKVMDEKLNQILSAQQTASINENLVLKVGDSIFKGKITGVNKSK